MTRAIIEVHGGGKARNELFCKESRSESSLVSGDRNCNCRSCGKQGTPSPHFGLLPPHSLHTCTCRTHSLTTSEAESVSEENSPIVCIHTRIQQPRFHQGYILDRSTRQFSAAYLMYRQSPQNCPRSDWQLLHDVRSPTVFCLQKAT
jgi:hypothetical protein